MTKMTIHEALGDVKLLSKKIEDKIYQTSFVDAKKGSSETSYKTKLTVEDCRSKMCAAYVSIVDSIKRRDLLKSKILHSNSITYITVGKETMTVAEAIERKKSIELKKALIEEMMCQHKMLSSFIESKNQEMESNLDKQLSGFGADSKSSSKDVEMLSDVYRKANGWELVDPLLLIDKAERLNDEVLEFEKNIDTKLSISNATTFIEIED